MKMFLDISIPEPEQKIGYTDKMLLTGSCFTEHIGNHFEELHFDTLQNPNGIIFDPSTVASSLISYIDGRQYGEDDLFYLNELWHSWQHHTRFSGVDREAVLQNINASQARAHAFLKTTRWLVITLGTSYSYRLTDNGQPVANCHRAPAARFQKKLMTIDETVTAMDTCLYRLFHFNAGLNIIFTVSPVRHIRDGVVENNRSKARLLEAVHHLVDKFPRLYYFPSYELVIDVLRDYRFYDIDLVHPNYAATGFVIEKFMEHFVERDSAALSREVEKIVTARRHKPFQPTTEAHRKFMQLYADRSRALMAAHPFLDLNEELAFFEAGA